MNDGPSTVDILRTVFQGIFFLWIAAHLATQSSLCFFINAWISSTVNVSSGLYSAAENELIMI